MTEDGNAEVTYNLDEIQKVTRTYKKLKKYMKSNIYEIRSLSGVDDTITKLLRDYGPDAESKDNTTERTGGE